MSGGYDLHDDGEPVPLELTPATLYILVKDAHNPVQATFYKKDVAEILQNYLGGLFFHSVMYGSSSYPEGSLDVNGEQVFVYKINAVMPGDFDKICNELREGGFSER